MKLTTKEQALRYTQTFHTGSCYFGACNMAVTVLLPLKSVVGLKLSFSYEQCILSYLNTFIYSTLGKCEFVQISEINQDIRELVDSLCRIAADTQYMQYLSKSHVTLLQMC